MPKNIMVCFDGTTNHPRDAKQERDWFGFGDIEDEGITNVVKLHALFGGNLGNEASRVTDASQHSLYYSGVGTYGNKIQRLFNAGFSPSGLDVATIMHSASRDLDKLYKPGDKLYVFGFSRGAAIARKFVSRLDRFLPKVAKQKQPVRFLGVFDTVASIGVPNLDDDDKPKSDVVFEDNRVSDYIQQALHLVAMDERRVAFQPTLVNIERKSIANPSSAGRTREIWFPGAHADIGGGFWHDGLSDITLAFMQDAVRALGENIVILDPDDVDYANLKGGSGRDAYEVDFADIDIRPSVTGKAHPKDRWGPVAALTLDPRKIRSQTPKGQEVLPLVHESVKRRVAEVEEYRPKALKGVAHHVMLTDGSIEMEGRAPKVYQGLRGYI